MRYSVMLFLLFIMMTWMKKYKKVTAALLVALPFPFIRFAIPEPITIASWDFDEPAVYSFDAERITVAESKAFLRAADPWFDPAWRYRRTVTIDGPEASESLSEFQVEIRLTDVNFNFAKAKTDGADLRFTSDDGLTLLSHWIEAYDALGERATVLVKLQDLSPGTSETVFLYYGNPSAVSTSDWAATFHGDLPGPKIRPVDADGEYNAGPGLVQFEDGTLAATYRKGSAHISDDGRLFLARSIDGGETWSSSLIFDNPSIDDRVDLGLTELADGTLMQPFYQFDSSGVTGSFILTSTDRGYSWSAPIPITNPLGGWIAVYGQIIELPEGMLLLPAYGANVGEFMRSLLLQSSDRGATWSLRSTIAYDGGRHYNEASVIQLNANDYLAVVRGDLNPTKLYRTVSHDGGLTWSSPTPFGYGASPNLIRLNQSTLVLTAADRDGITGIRAQVSTDNGDTWSYPIVIDRGNLSQTDLGYPATVAVGKTEFLALYYKDFAIKSVVFTLDHLWSDPNFENIFEGLEDGTLEDWSAFGASWTVQISDFEQRSGQNSLELRDDRSDFIPQASRPIYGSDQQTGTVSFWLKPVAVPNGLEFGLLDGWFPQWDKRFWLRVTPAGQLDYNFTTGPAYYCNAWAPTPTPATIEFNRWVKFTLRFNTVTNQAEVLVNGESFGLIGGCRPDEDINRFGLSASSVTGTGDHVYLDDLYGQQYAAFPPTVSVGSERTRLPINSPAIVPVESVMKPALALESLIEQANKNGGEITYQLSPDGGTAWFWWSGANWQSTAGGAQESTTAAVVNAHAASFPATGGPMLFRAFLHSDGSQLVKLDAVNIRYLSD